MFDVAEQLQAKAHTVDIITYGEQAEGQPSVTRVSRSGNSLMRYVRMCKAIRAQVKPETIIVATDVFSIGIPTRLALIGKKNQFVLRLGGEWAWEDVVTKGRYIGTLRNFWKQHAGIRMWLQRKNYQWITKRAKTIFVTSSFLGDILSQFVGVPKNKIHLAENQSSFESHTHPFDSSKPLRLLYIGRFAPVKNVVFLTRILLACEQAGLSFSATLIGDGPDLSSIRYLLRESKRITVRPPVDREGVAQAFAEHDACLLPSLSDICPNIVLEALASGLPCLITSEHGLAKPVPGTVELNPEDEQAWKDTLKEWIKNPSKVESMALQIKPQTKQSTPSLADQIISFVQAK